MAYIVKRPDQLKRGDVISLEGQWWTVVGTVDGHKRVRVNIHREGIEGVRHTHLDGSRDVYTRQRGE